jgi:aspartyl/asparaginyl beta-hydroxylase (cupin superfamily)
MLALHAGATYSGAMGSSGDQQAARRANALGLEALRAGNADAAVHHFAAATAADPPAVPLWHNLAHAHRLAGNPAGERAALESALSLDRTDFVAQLRMAQLLERTGEELAAIQAWSGALQLAEALPARPPALEAELSAGRAFVASLESRLAAATEAALAPLAAGLGATEARRIQVFSEVALGKRQVFLNHCAGAHYPFLPADEFFDERHFEWFAAFESAAPAIRRELDALLAQGDELLRPYIRMEEGTPANLWSELDGSLDWGACFLWEYGAPNGPVLERCPETAAMLASLPLQRIPGRAPNAFFSLLRPGKHIPPHTGVTNTRAIVHLALDVSPGCGFRVGGETREWVENKAFAFDDTIEHEAWNNSDRRRAVLIVDTWNPHLSPGEREAVAAYFAASDAALGAR